MPDDEMSTIADLNNNLNNLTEQRLEATRRAAQVAHGQSPTPGTFADVLQAQGALDTFWEASVADQQQVVSEAQNLPGLPDNTEEWFQQTEAADERRRVADLYADDPEYQALGSVAEERETAIAEAVGVMPTPEEQAQNEAWEIEDGNRGNYVVRPGRDYAQEAEASLAESNDQPGAASFADEVDAWYAAVQPTGEVRRVRDADLFDPNGFSQQVHEPGVVAEPVSDEFAAAFQPGNEWWNKPENGMSAADKLTMGGPTNQGPGSARWQARMNENPSLAASVARHPVSSQGPPPPLPGQAPTLKL